VTRSIAQGRRVGLASALGVETGTLVHITAATVGLSALIASSAIAFNVVRYLGRPVFVRRQRYLTGAIYLSLAAVASLAGGERRR
jgi:threonine/homoserine/homoserine lactone efflux protein